MPLNALPEITEVKETLTGARKTFSCHVIERNEGAAVVLFVSRAPVRVHDVELPAGTVTFGYFWTERDYNVYHWMSPDGATRAFYVNLSEGARLEGDVLTWRDLTVDILIPPVGEPVVLDEDEIPPTLDPATHRRIERAKHEVLSRASLLRVELEVSSDALWARLHGRERHR